MDTAVTDVQLELEPSQTIESKLLVAAGHNMSESKADEPILLHSSLRLMPQNMRFLMQGILSNFLFITGLQMSMQHFEPLGYGPSFIYAVFYSAYIPVGHLQSCLLVFGWPTGYYLKSLLSVVPIGASSMAIGSFCTGWLSSVNFDVNTFYVLQKNISFLVGPDEELDEEEIQGAYSAFVVTLITSVWTFALTSLVMSPSKKVDSKKGD